jgi:hypothetical protein
MLICADTAGKVMILRIYSYFKRLTYEKIMWMESSFNQVNFLYQTIECLFDEQSEDAVIALASSDHVSLISVDQKNGIDELLKFRRPRSYASDNLKGIVEIPEVQPCLSFGFI